MIVPRFTFSEDANAWLSEPFAVEESVEVHLTMSRRAPVVILKEEADGSSAIYGQSPKESDAHQFDIRSTDPVVIRLATPIEVMKCYIL